MEFEIGCVYDVHTREGYEFHGRVSAVRQEDESEDLRYVTFDIPAYVRDVKSFRDNKKILSTYDILYVEKIDEPFDETPFSDGFKNALIELTEKELAQFARMLLEEYSRHPEKESAQSSFYVLRPIFDVLHTKVVYGGNFFSEDRDVLSDVNAAALHGLVEVARKEASYSEETGWAAVLVSLSKEILRRRRVGVK